MTPRPGLQWVDGGCRCLKTVEFDVELIMVLSSPSGERNGAGNLREQWKCTRGQGHGSVTKYLLIHT